MTTPTYTRIEIRKKLRSKLPAFPHNYNAETDTVTLIPAELKVWKKQLLKVLNAQTLVDLEVEIPGICGVIEHGVHRTCNGRVSVLLDTAQTIIYNCTYSISKNWKHYSGLQHYPIWDKTDVPLLLAPTQYHQHPTTRWVGRQRKLRISALQCWISNLPPEGLTIQVVHTHN